MVLKKIFSKFLVYRVHKGQTWRRPALSANTSPTGSYSSLFPKQLEPNSFPKCPWRNKTKSVRTGSRVLRNSTRQWVGDPQWSRNHNPTRSCGYFEVWDIHGPGWGNGCSHPAFQKDGSRLEMYAAHTLWEERFIYCAETFLWHNRHHKDNNSLGFMSPKSLKKNLNPLLQSILKVYLCWKKLCDSLRCNFKEIRLNKKPILCKSFLAELCTWWTTYMVNITLT